MNKDVWLLRVTSTCFEASIPCTIVVQQNSIIAPWQYNTMRVVGLNLKYVAKDQFLTPWIGKEIKT